MSPRWAAVADWRATSGSRRADDVSVAVAQHDLLPAVNAHPDVLVLADGFSCRTQLAELGDRRAITLAELLASRL